MRTFTTMMSLSALLFLASNTSAFVFDQDDPPEPTPVDELESAPASGADATAVRDEEDSTKTTAKKKEEADHIEGGEFVGVNAPRTWHLRNGFGVSVGLGSLFCYRDYCNSVIDVNMFGSITGTLGGFYRLNPNLVFTLDFMTGYMNTNLGAIPIDTPPPAKKDHAMLMQPSVGAEFHLPVLGWFDPYIGLSLGYSFMRLKATAPDVVYKEKWHGVNIEPRLGANMFFWSTGFARNLALGAYMKMGFPVWPKLCRIDESAGTKDCDRPSNSRSSAGNADWASTPFTLQMSLEARYYF
ncbi:MAG: hypothetical protein M0R76_09920 [Proteobacteria bacterium]|nr:hypothetical protein [Pseudomonadota bacterium]